MIISCRSFHDIKRIEELRDFSLCRENVFLGEEISMNNDRLISMTTQSLTVTLYLNYSHKSGG